MKILEPIKIGNNSFQNRMVMAPMTRSRADENGIVGNLTVLYYAQRSTAGLIITEAINISEQAIGSPLTPGLYSKQQIEAWKKVTEAVHKEGGKIFAQLWHTGRVGHSIDKKGSLPVAPSSIAINGQQHFTSKGMKDYEIPRSLAISEIKQIVKDYKQAAVNAIEAGFDGVELHGAFGYLPNQFLVESANQRTDEYGGSIENRSRFVLEVMQDIVNAIGRDRAGIKLSPTIPFNSILDSNPTSVYTHLINELDKLSLSYIHLMNPMFPLDELPHYPKDVLETFGKLSKHLIIANGGYTHKTGEHELERGIAKMISFATLFIANPDLPKRFELNADLNQLDKATMYGGGENGYIDYPSL
ncbi:MAG: alkene reductase [Rhizobacter sp.]|nr:alkene reductase [Ferruginibacter sp.]